jgi:hypothetical protein
MTKYLLFLHIFIFSSCAQFTIQDYKTVYEAAFLKGDNDISITKEYVDSREYSFAKVQIGDDVPAILVLAFIQNDLFVWISAEGQKLVTKNGKIIETYGLKYNFKVLDSRNYKLSQSEFNLLAQLDNPKAIIKYNSKISTEFNQDLIDRNVKGLFLYSEEYSSSPIKWRGKNFYWVDPITNLTIRTNQSIHPYEDRLLIDFYYK